MAAAAAAATEPLCRLCLSHRDTVSVFASPAVADRILACVHVQIAEGDALPTQICKRCITNVNNWHNFKLLCDKTQQKLHAWFANEEFAAPQTDLKLESASEDNDDLTIDAAYPGIDSLGQEGHERLQPEGPPILASLGLAPKNEKESDEENTENWPVTNMLATSLGEDGENSVVPVGKLTSKDCLVCGRAYRYSHNARRHERNAHSYDRYTNKIDPNPVSPTSSLKTSPFKPKMSLLKSKASSSDKIYQGKHKQAMHFLSESGEPEILKSLLTARSDEYSDSDNSRSNSSQETVKSEPDLTTCPVETVTSVPDTYMDNSSDDDNEDVKPPKTESRLQINSKIDINRIIGIEDDVDHEDDDDDDDDSMEKGNLEIVEDEGPACADSMDAENTHNNEQESKPDVKIKEEKQEAKDPSDEDSQDDEEDDDDDDIRVPIVPIVEINEKDDADSDDEDSDETEEGDDIAIIKPVMPSSNRMTITVTQKAFIEKHRDIIEQINTKKCKCCNRDFPRRKAVIQHLQKNGFKIPKHTCYTCVLPFTHIGALLSHMRYNCCKDTWKLIYRKDGIPDDMVVDEPAMTDLQDGSNEEVLKFPYKDVLNARSYICKLCPEKYKVRQFILKHVLDAHESAAPDVPPLTCYNCKYRFSDHRLWRKHLRNGECTILIECDICSASFLNVQDFNEHAVKTHSDEAPRRDNHSKITHTLRSTDCPICEETLVTYDELVKHLRSIHNEVKPHMCQYCNSKFKHFTDLHQHIYMDHSEVALKEEEDDDDDGDSVKEEMVYNYSCTDCSAVFETVEGWTDHQIQAHNHVAYECDRCNKKFWDETELEEHKATHVRPQLFKCTHCSNSFSSSQKLSEHMTQYHRMSSNADRTMESQFYCEICIRSFKSRQAFSNHMRIHAKVPTTNRRAGEAKRPVPPSEAHRTPNPPARIQPRPPIAKVIQQFQTNGAPYSCDICGKGFIHKKNIWKHKKMLHADIVNKMNKEGAETSISKNISTEEDEYTNEEPHGQFMTPQFDSFVSAVYDQQENNSGSESALLYSCDLCDKRFAVKSSIWKHKRKKHGVISQLEPQIVKTQISQEIPRTELNRICCTICKISFPDKKAYYRHRKVVHKGSQLQMCTFCGITLSTSAEWYEHLQTAHAKELLVSNSKSQKKVQMPSANLSSDDDDEDLPPINHSKNNRDNKHTCEVCEKTFADMISLQNHACSQRHAIAETYDCEICNKSYTSISALKSHRGWHLRSPDGRAAFSNSGLWMPQNKVTNKVSKHEVLDVAHPKAAPVVSHKEMSTLNLKRKLPPDVQVTLLKKAKLSTDSPAEPSAVMTPQERQLAMKDGRYCEPCGKAFSKRAALQRHIEEKHKSSNVVCPICSKSFTRKSTLLMHMRKHDTGEVSEPPDQDDESDDELEDTPPTMPPRPTPPVQIHTYRCEICNMQYNSSKALRRHRVKYHGIGRPANFNQVTPQRFHEQQSPNRSQQVVTTAASTTKDFKCGLCNDEWETEQDLLNHPHYNCNVCNLYFSQPQSLAAHTKTRHPEKDHTLFPCTKCDRFYMNKKSLQRHVDTFH